jgi:prophage antirepressor-like protein
MELTFENQTLNASVRTVRNGDEIVFYAKDVAKALRYKSPSKAVRTHVWEEDKYLLKDIPTGSSAPPVGKYRPETVLTNEQGLYQLIFVSEIERAKEFGRWVFKEILPSVPKQEHTPVQQKGHSLASR